MGGKLVGGVGGFGGVVLTRRWALKVGLIGWVVMGREVEVTGYLLFICLSVVMVVVVVA